MSYLGFTLTPQGITPGKDKLESIKNAKSPTDLKMVRSFFSLCNFFRTHIKNFLLISAPLTKLNCKDSECKGGPLPPDAEHAFRMLQLALTSEPVGPIQDRTVSSHSLHCQCFNRKLHLRRRPWCYPHTSRQQQQFSCHLIWLMTACRSQKITHHTSGKWPLLSGV